LVPLVLDEHGLFSPTDIMSSPAKSSGATPVTTPKPKSSSKSKGTTTTAEDTKTKPKKLKKRVCICNWGSECAEVRTWLDSKKDNNKCDDDPRAGALKLLDLSAMATKNAAVRERWKTAVLHCLGATERANLVISDWTKVPVAKHHWTVAQLSGCGKSISTPAPLDAAQKLAHGQVMDEDMAQVTVPDTGEILFFHLPSVPREALRQEMQQQNQPPPSSSSLLETENDRIEQDDNINHDGNNNNYSDEEDHEDDDEDARKARFAALDYATFRQMELTVQTLTEQKETLKDKIKLLQEDKAELQAEKKALKIKVMTIVNKVYGSLETATTRKAKQDGAAAAASTGTAGVTAAAAATPKRTKSTL